MKILVVVDMQNDFIDGALRNEQGMQIVDNVVAKINEYRDEGNRVVFTMDTHDTNYMETQEGKNLPVPHCIKDTIGWKLNYKVNNARKDIDEVFMKTTFGSVDLARNLMLACENNDVTEIEFIGLCTDICVINNVAVTKAMIPEIPLVVDAACCAGVTPETHDNALNAMAMLQVKIENQGEEPWRK